MGYLGTAPSRRWARLIAWTFEYGHRAVCGGGLVVARSGFVDEMDAVVEVDSESGKAGGWGGYLGTTPSRRWANLIAWICEHGQRAQSSV